jgi:hypothetical protein
MRCPLNSILARQMLLVPLPDKRRRPSLANGSALTDDSEQ